MEAKKDVLKKLEVMGWAVLDEKLEPVVTCIIL